MFYDYQKILSYNAMINILIGERGVGKTYGATRFVISQFLKKREQFCYIRRYKPELKKACPNFFDAIKTNNEFEGVSLSSKGTTFYCNDEVCRICNDTGHCTRSEVLKLFKSENYYI